MECRLDAPRALHEIPAVDEIAARCTRGTLFQSAIRDAVEYAIEDATSEEGDGPRPIIHEAACGD